MMRSSERCQVLVQLVPGTGKSLFHKFGPVEESLLLRLGRVYRNHPHCRRRAAAILGERRCAQRLERPIRLKRMAGQVALLVGKRGDEYQALRRDDFAIYPLAPHLEALGVSLA